MAAGERRRDGGSSSCRVENELPTRTAADKAMARKETFVWHCAVSHCLGDKPRPIGRWTTWKF